MESAGFLLDGLMTALHPTNLIFAFIGCVIGTLVGVLPGIGPSAAIAILIPTTFALDATPAIIMLASIFYGTQYGGTITAVLFNTPGEGSAAITCLDGYEMAKRGRAGAALSISAIGSFVGGTLTTMALAFVALPLTALALKFGPPEYFTLMVMAMSLVAALSGQSLIRGLVSATLGLLVAMVGIDPVAGLPRFTFGVPSLMEGVAFVPVVMGLFGIGEILLNLEDPKRRLIETRLDTLIPTRADVKRSTMPVLRGTVIGFFVGLVPGLGSNTATFMSYIAEKRFSRTPEKFGTGMIEGVAGPETANNAAANAALLPLLTLGIPGSGVVALLMGAFMMNGIIPGPLMFKEHGDVVWAVIASLYVGNVILLILNLPLIPVWVSVLKVPYAILFALILGFSAIGAYSLSNNTFDLGLMIAFGVVGYVFKKLDFPIVPFTMTLILGPLMEQGLRQSLEMSQGDFTIFLERPIAAAFLVLSVLFAAGTVFGTLRKLKGSDDET